MDPRRADFLLPELGRRQPLCPRTPSGTPRHCEGGAGCDDRPALRAARGAASPQRPASGKRRAIPRGSPAFLRKGSLPRQGPRPEGAWSERSGDRARCPRSGHPPCPLSSCRHDRHDPDIPACLPTHHHHPRPSGSMKGEAVDGTGRMHAGQGHGPPGPLRSGECRAHGGMVAHSGDGLQPSADIGPQAPAMADTVTGAITMKR